MFSCRIYSYSPGRKLFCCLIIAYAAFKFLQCHVAGKLVASIVIADSLKSESKMAINKLHKMGMKVILLTGDNERTANYIASQVIVYIFICRLVKLSVSDNLPSFVKREPGRRTIYAC